MSLPPLDKGWMALHDNSPNPDKGKTRWGLVIDLQKSKYRFNINFGVLTDSQFFSLAESPDLTPEQRQRILDLGEAYVEEEYHADPRVLIAHAKRNMKPGKGAYKLVPDYDVLALLDLRKGSENPRVVLVWGDESYLLDDWYVPASDNETIVARHDLKAEKLEVVE